MASEVDSEVTREAVKEEASEADSEEVAEEEATEMMREEKVVKKVATETKDLRDTETMVIEEEMTTSMSHTMSKKPMTDLLEIMTQEETDQKVET